MILHRLSELGVLYEVMNLNVESEDVSTSLLELAANNDVEGFRRCIDEELSSVDDVGLWYGRRKGSSQMVLQPMTPLMVAATYGSVDVLKMILSLPEIDVNRACGADKTTALHYAASGGSVAAVDVVKLLLSAGADPSLADANGRRPVDVIVVSPKLESVRCSLQMLLCEEIELRWSMNSNLNANSMAFEAEQAFKAKANDIILVQEKKEYPVDPSLPDIKNSIYSTDEFRMFTFKVRPCSRAYSHDWTECPFVHPGENARRRDPRKYHYSCVPCPDFRKGACRRGDMCEYAHGVFECWLHPAQYRTRLCKDGTACNRRVCFFAHAQDELRPLYVSTGSAVPSPRSASSPANAMDFAAAAMNFLPGSPSSVPTNGMPNHAGWPSQQTVPALHLPGSNFQSSRLRLSLNARDIPPEYLNLFGDGDAHQQQLMNDQPLMSQPSMLNRGEGSSPRYSDLFSPTQKSAVFNQFQHQQQGMLSPIKTSFSPRNVDHSLMKSPFSVPSGRMSPHNLDPVSPMGARVSMLTRHENQHQQFRSLSSRDLGTNAAAAVASLEDPLSKWGNPSGPPDWYVGADDPGKLKRSSSFELLNNDDEPDLSWVQSLVKESPQDTKEKSTPDTGPASTSGGNQTEQVDQSVLGAWLEQMQLDQLMAQ